MATSKQPDTQPLPPQAQPQPGALPTEGDEVREVGKRAHADVSGGRKDTDQTGYESQRGTAPSTAPTKRSGVVDGSSD